MSGEACHPAMGVQAKRQSGRGGDEGGAGVGCTWMREKGGGGKERGEECSLRSIAAPACSLQRQRTGLPVCAACASRSSSDGERRQHRR